MWRRADRAAAAPLWRLAIIGKASTCSGLVTVPPIWVYAELAAARSIRPRSVTSRMNHRARPGARYAAIVDVYPMRDDA